MVLGTEDPCLLTSKQGDNPLSCLLMDNHHATSEVVLLEKKKLNRNLSKFMYSTTHLQEIQRTEERVRSHHRGASRNIPTMGVKHVKQLGFFNR